MKKESVLFYKKKSRCYLRMLFSILFFSLFCFHSPVFADETTVIVCSGESVVLDTGDDDYLNFSWSVESGPAACDNCLTNTTAKDATFTASTPGEYTVVFKSKKAGDINDNLIYNGSFELGDNGTDSFVNGDFGFYTDYGFQQDDWGEALHTEGKYSLTSNPRNVHCCAAACSPQDGGRMMVVNGGSNSDAIVWQQDNITILPNNYYEFSVWVARWDEESTFTPAELQFTINGVPLGEVFEPLETPCEWKKIYVIWYSGDNTNVSIQLKNKQIDMLGNDFAIDYVYFGESTDITKTYKIDVKKVSASASAINPKCSDGKGSGIISISGGTAPYEYSLTGSTPFTSIASGEVIENLPAGTTTITIQDSKGCTTTTSATIIVPTQITASAAAENPNCFGGLGKAKITLSGGTGIYEYSLTGNAPWISIASGNYIENLPEGETTIYIQDSNKCPVTTSATIVIPTQLTVSAIETNSNCSDDFGNAKLAITGGSGIYEYSLTGAAPWTSIATGGVIENLPDGVTTITVRDSKGCTASTTATIAIPTPVIASAVIENPLCSAGFGKAEITLSGGTGTYEYSLTGAAPFTSIASGEMIENLPAGTTTITIQDSKGCTTTTSATIVIPAQLTVSATNDNLVCFGNFGNTTLTISGGTGIYEYSLTGNAPWTSIASGNIIGNLPEGTTAITVRDSNGCTATTASAVSIININLAGNSNISLGNTTQLTANISSGNWISRAMAIATVDATGLVTGVNEGSTWIIYETSEGCADSLMVTITKISEVYKTESVTICKGETIKITADEGRSYSWDTGETSRAIEISPESDAEYICTIMPLDNGNAILIMTFSVDVVKPVTDFQITTNPEKITYVPGETVEFKVIVPDYSGSFVWNEDSGNISNTYSSQIFLDKTITVKIPAGVCPEVSREKSVKVEWPNAIAPYSGSIANSTFLSELNYKLFVFNRFGQIVYEGTNGWDGKYKGKIVDPGTYYYVLELPNDEVRKATVEVVKEK